MFHEKKGGAVPALSYLAEVAWSSPAPSVRTAKKKSELALWACQTKEGGAFNVLGGWLHGPNSECLGLKTVLGEEKNLALGALHGALFGPLCCWGGPGLLL